ncbi:MAG TPA: helix-turn-helix domain-containing protein [Chloroflexia bacterium]|nr:helix-turn-helix domain-containing protein [Chloroflexia bacterium]
MEAAAVEKLIEEGESHRVEFKIAAPRDAELAERICGFANGTGGYIVIGVVDGSWEVKGVRNVAATTDVILKAARLCNPTVRLDPPHPEVVVLQGKSLVIATIPPNDGTIYQASGRFWLRRGTHTVPLEAHDLQEFFYNRGFMRWETRPVLKATLADLDTDLLKDYLQQRPQQNRQAGRLTNLETVLLNLDCAVETREENGQSVIRPTNAGMLLFGYNPQDFIPQAEVICIMYGDKVGLRRYLDRKILHGNIVEQIEQAAVFFKQHVPVAARMAGFNRIDEPDYPLEALREAVVNAVVHRDYSLQGETVRIFYYADRIEIHNPGLLMPGIGLKELQKGQARSKPRNPVITRILRDLPGGYMEQVGSGISYMINQMRELGKPEPHFREQGEFIVTFEQGKVSTTLERPPATTESTGAEQLEAAKPQFTAEEEFGAPRGGILTEERRKERALQYVHKYGSITNKEYREITGASDNTALRDLEDLVQQGSLRATGKRRGRKYLL